MKKALVVIDLQNDYFPGGQYPLWNTEETLNNVEKAIEKAKENDVMIILVQHVADKSLGLSPFFNEETEGVKIHARILTAAPDAPIVVKTFADSFHQTILEEILADNNIEELLIVGMMTQNCVTHTAVSKAADKYSIKVLADCTTTVDQMIHMIALAGLTSRMELSTIETAF